MQRSHVNHRHGARLDQADRQWHLTSPTPYDPPLTYGGWTQAKAQGQRIAALLHHRANPDHGDTETRPPLDPLSKPKRRHRIVIHTSPYLRCLQTSIGIAAGIAQFQPSFAPPNAHGPHKALLRVDAFLGEWQCPDYFKDITTPPSSSLMVKGAKDELLNRADYIEVHHGAHNSHGHFPGGWARGASGTQGAPRQTTDAASPAVASHTLPRRERSSSQGNASSGRVRSRNGTANYPNNVYNPPLPTYAVGPIDSIPRGYVAHARDACVDVDWPWDSSRPPLNWGDGGPYDEEWKSMHMRFRKGLGCLMKWYKDTGLPSKNKWLPLTYSKPVNGSGDTGKKGTSEEEDEGDEDLVVILVTHGAGAHALLCAIANRQEPVDIPMASLTMATRRAEPRQPSSPSYFDRRTSSLPDAGMSLDYDIEVKASIDHLQPSVNPAMLPKPNAQTKTFTPLEPSFTRPEYRRRYGSRDSVEAAPITQYKFGPSQQQQSASASLRGGTRRTSSYFSSAAARGGSNNGVPMSPSTGLWSGASTPAIHDPSPSGWSDFPNFNAYGGFQVRSRAQGSGSSENSNHSATRPISPTLETMDGTGKETQKQEEEGTTEERDDNEGNDTVTPLPSVNMVQRSPSIQRSQAPVQGQQGLWGSPRLDDIAEREKGYKRRWTMSEHD